MPEAVPQASTAKGVTRVKDLTTVKDLTEVKEASRVETPAPPVLKLRALAARIPVSFLFP